MKNCISRARATSSCLPFTETNQKERENSNWLHYTPCYGGVGRVFAIYMSHHDYYHRRHCCCCYLSWFYRVCPYTPRFALIIRLYTVTVLGT